MVAAHKKTVMMVTKATGDYQDCGIRAASLSEWRLAQWEAVYINGDEVERVKSFKFLGVQITNNLSWSPHADTIVKKAHQHLYFFRRLRKFGMSATTLTNFYRCTIDNILSRYITAWYGSCSVQDCKKLQNVMNVAQSTMQTSLPSIDCLHFPLPQKSSQHN